MTDTFLEAAAAKIAPRFGLTPTAMVFAATTLFAVGTTLWQNITRFDAGWDAAVAEMREGGIELDGKTLKIMNEADRKALDALGRGQSAAQSYAAVRADTAAALEEILARHSNNRQDPERNNVPQTAWGAAPLPDHVRVRLDRIARERANAGGESPDRAADDRSGATGHPAADAPPDSP